MSDLETAFEDLRADARTTSTGGDILLYKPTPGDWVAGVFVGFDTRQAPFGDVTVAQLCSVKTAAGPFPDRDVKRLDLDAMVLKLELAPDGENTPEVGGLVYVEYAGERTSKMGKRYKGYTVRVKPPTDESRALARSCMQNPGPAGPKADADDLPFQKSVA